MDSEKKGLGTRIAEKVRLRAVNKMVSKLEERRVSVEKWINEALEEGLTSEEFEERVIEYLTLLYENKITGLGRSEDDIKREAARIVASYEYRKDHPEEKKEEDLNNATDLERQMDVITGVYEPMLQAIETKGNDYISKVNVPTGDGDIELTPAVVDTIINDTDGLVKSISDFKYLIDRKFKDVVSFATLNRKYKELTGKDYAKDPNGAFRELTTKLYSQLQVHLNTIVMALNTNFDELDKAGISEHQRVSAFENIDKLLGTLDRIYESAKLDSSISSDLKDSILEKDALKDAVEARLARVKINGKAPERSTGEGPSDTSEDKPKETPEGTFVDEGPEKRTPWYKRTIEKLKGIIPTREKKEKGETKGPRTPIFGGRTRSSVITTKLTEEEIKELITRYKTGVAEFNEKAEKFNDLNVAIKAQYGGMTATSVEEIYEALKTFTFVSSYEEIAKLEQDARKLRQEMDSIEVGLLSDRVKYLGATGRTLATVEELKELKLNKPKGVLETSAILDFVTAHDKNRLVIEHRLNEIAVELTDSAISPEKRAELEKEKGKLEQYFISENSIITRAIVEACQADRTLSVDKINEQRKEKFKEIKAEIIAKLAKTRRPDTPDIVDYVKEKAKPILDEFGYDVLKMEGMGYGQMLNFISHLENTATRKTFGENLSIIKELGLEDHMYEKKYQMVLVDPNLKAKYEALKAAGISKEDIVDKWLKQLFDRSISLEMLNAEIAKAKTGDKPLTPDTKEAILAKFTDLKSYPLLQKCSFSSLKLLTEVPEELIRKNDEYIDRKNIDGKYIICELLTSIDLEEKHAYIKGLTGSSCLSLLADRRKDTLEEFKAYCTKAISDFIEYMKKTYDLDYSVLPERKQGEFPDYMRQIKMAFYKKEMDANIAALKTVFTNAEIVEKFSMFDLFYDDIAKIIGIMKEQGLTTEEIKDNYKLITAYYEKDEDIIKAIEPIIAARKKDDDKPLTPEAEKKEILDKFSFLGLKELDNCSLEDLRALNEADIELVKKNAEYIKAKKIAITYVSLCDYLTCVDFDKKYDFLSGSDEKINIHSIIINTKDLTYEQFKEHYKKMIDEFVQAVKDECGFDITKCKGINDVELIKVSVAYKLEYNKGQFKSNLAELKELFTVEEIYERFEASDLFNITIRKNLEAMRTRGLTDEEIRANYELLTLISPDYSALNKKIDEIIAARVVEDKPEDKKDEPEEPKLEGAAISEGKIELGRLRFNPNKTEEADRTKDAVERNVPMLRVEVYKNGIRVELYKEVKEQLKKLQVKVALVGKNKDGEWSKRAVAGTTTKIKPGETIDIVHEDFDPEEYALQVQSSYKDGDDYSEHKDTIRIR